MQQRTVIISGPLAYETRGEQQVTGFELQGFAQGPFVEGGIGCRNGRTNEGPAVLTQEQIVITVNDVPL